MKNSKQSISKERFTAKQLPSGFWCVLLDGQWINAAMSTEQAANEYIDSVVKSGLIRF